MFSFRVDLLIQLSTVEYLMSYWLCFQYVLRIDDLLLLALKMHFWNFLLFRLKIFDTKIAVELIGGGVLSNCTSFIFFVLSW